MQRILFSVLIVFCICFQTPAQEEIRTWSSKNGSYTVEATFVSIKGDQVKLKKSDGETIEVSLSVFSDADRIYIESKSDPGKSVTKKIDKELRNKFAKLGVRVSNNELALNEETKLSRGFSDARRVRKNLNDLQNKIKRAMALELEYRNQLRQLTILDGQLNAELAKIGPKDVLKNNQIVGAIEANRAKMLLIYDEFEVLQENLESVRKELSKERDTYLQHTLNLRNIADEISKYRLELANDDKLKALIDEAKKKTGLDLRLAETKSFSRSMKRLKDLEDTVLSESIPLQRRGNTYSVAVNLNGKHTTEMIVDSGASAVTLPWRTASQFGLQPRPDDPKIELTLADGRKIQGQLISAKSIRVGKFTVEDVTCVVLGTDAPNAEALLGMTFLGNFKVELNAAESSLSMVKIADQ